MENAKGEEQEYGVNAEKDSGGGEEEERNRQDKREDDIDVREERVGR